MAVQANSPDQAESQIHSLERAGDGIDSHINADKTAYMCTNQRCDIYTLKGGPLKLVDKFTYQGGSVSSTENDISTRLAKAWTAFDRLSVIWKSDLTDKIKQFFSKQQSYRYCYMDAPHTWTLTKHMEKSLTEITQEFWEQYWTSPGSSTLQSSSCTATYHPSRKLSKLDELDMRDTAGEVRTNSEGMYCGGRLHMDERRQDDQPESLHNSFVPIQDVAWKTSRKRWTIEKGWLAAQHDDDDISPWR